MHLTRFLLPTIFFLFLVISGCKDQGKGSATLPDNAEIPEYILSHTSGEISRAAKVVVTFSASPASPQNISISLSPTVEGETELRGRQLVFTPTEPLESGQTYQATVGLQGEEDFSFSFIVRPRQLEVIVDGMYVPDPNQPQRVEVTGQVLTNDAATVEEIAPLLTATYAGKPVAVEVSQGDRSNTFDFVTRIADRGEAASTVVIEYDGNQGGFAGVSGRREVALAGINDFRVIDVQTSPDRQSVVVRFSNPLDGRQDLKGLVSFAGGLRFTTSTDGNLLRVFPGGSGQGLVSLILDGQLRSTAGTVLGQTTTHELQLGQTKPGLRQVGNGTIMPHEGQRLFTFEAVGLKTVYLEVFRIHAGNVQQFLQENQLNNSSDEWSLRRVGRLLTREEIDLSTLASSASAGRWSRYAIDLGEYVEQEAGAVYQIRLAFGMEHTQAGCDDGLAGYQLPSIAEQLAEDEFAVGFNEVNSLMGGYYGIYGYVEGYEWNDENPCRPGYYNRDRFLLQNVISSNLGLIAKRNPDRSTLVFATNILEAGPQSGVTVTAYSYDQEEIFRGTTDGEGRVVMTTELEPAVIVGQVNNDYAYLGLEYNQALALSRFDVGGREAANGMKGAFYADRGVWRPGDTVFLNFVLEDRQQLLPENYPVEFVLYDVQGRVVERRNVMPSFGTGLYPLTFVTDSGDPTGPWRATVNAGGKTYDRFLLIETVKPNRLDVALNAPDEGLKSTTRELELTADWLYGAPGSGLGATVTMGVGTREPDFADFPDYVFFDPARRYGMVGDQEVFEGKLDQNGRAKFTLPELGDQPPGPLRLRFLTKVFEPGGNFSTDAESLPYDPYTIYAGVKLPTGRWGGKTIERGERSNVELTAVDPSGRGVGNRRLTVGIYRVDWRYWWQDNYDNVARFSSSRHTEAVQTMDATTDANGRATVSVGNFDDWGRYLIRVCDSGGHCTGDYFYNGYDGQGDGDREQASILQLRAERETVNRGESVNIKLPTSAGGQLLVSLETGAGSIEQFWRYTEAGETEITFNTDERMVPTVYANVTYLQPYAQTTNDRPVRLFGVVPVEVLDPETILEPEVAVAESWKPNETVQVEVSEANDHPMTYTLAVVDEGLLGLTNFTTPDLHDDFFAKEALSVRTYDLYTHVMSSINGEFGKVLAIGGGGELAPGAEVPGADRFIPVVRHLGPFRLESGTATHSLSLPNYTGAVRVMVVANDRMAYGSTAERVPVKQALMVMPTLPRVLGPGERVDMPISVFATEARIQRVDLSVDESEGLATLAAPAGTMNFSQTGSQLTYVPLNVGERTGVARFAVAASSGGERSTQEIEIDVRHPNTVVSRSNTLSLAPGQRQRFTYDNFGLPGTREATVELSGLPAMNLQRHLRSLLRYPYGCAEQTISPAFAQLYLDKVMELSDEQERLRRNNVVSGIEAMRKFVTASGGLAYWPGQGQSHPWATNYGLHFLLEAEKAGFAVPFDLKEGLIEFQERAAGGWNGANEQFYYSRSQRVHDQAYRLYGLALAGKADVGAMNRLRANEEGWNLAARFQLAAAYAMVGRAETAKELVAGQTGAIDGDYRELGYTFGSNIRDMAIILAAQLEKDNTAAADEQILRLARAIGERNWLNTQEAAYAFISLGKLADLSENPIQADFALAGGNSATVGATSGIYSIELPANSAQGSFTLENTGQSTVYVTTITAGKPRPGAEQTVSSKLSLQVSYTDLEGEPISVESLVSGTDFIATYSVTNPGSTGTRYRQMALQSLLPSGWEVSNTRLQNFDLPNDASDYQDYRDDRVHTFFSLGIGETKRFSFRMTATYPGRYYLPTQVSEAMYDFDIRSEVKGRWVEVTRPAR